MSKYKVLVTQFGAFPKDRIITLDEIKTIYPTFGQSDLDRALSLKAIGETEKPVTVEPLEVGPENSIPAPEPLPAPAMKEVSIKPQPVAPVKAK